MRIEPFHIQDYAEIEMANDIGFEKWGLKTGVVPLLMHLQRTGTYFTVRDDKGILAIAGYHQAFEGIVEVSFFPSVRFTKAPYSVVKALKRGLAELKGRCRRIQLNCRAEGPFRRFAEALGFEYEGRMKSFDPSGRDHLMMAIVRQA
jgi:RimJ/RimL family protein N-acetyltransferase